MVKYGRAFHKGLARLSVDWAHVDYDYYKAALKAMANLEATVLHTDFLGEGAEAEGMRAMDAAFRRSLLSDIFEGDQCFGRQCARVPRAHCLRVNTLRALMNVPCVARRSWLPERGCRLWIRPPMETPI